MASLIIEILMYEKLEFSFNALFDIQILNGLYYVSY